MREVASWHVLTVFESSPFGRCCGQTGHRDKAKMEQMTHCRHDDRRKRQTSIEERRRSESIQPSRVSPYADWLVGHSVNNVCFDEFASIGTKRFEVLVADTLDGLVIHLLDGPAVSRTKHNSPPIVR